MQIRRSIPADLPELLTIYEGARRFMAEHGNPRQWGATGWPPEMLLRSDIAAGKSYVCTGDGGEILGTFFFRFGEDIEPTYREMSEGSWLDRSPYGVVHRIAVRDHGQGVGAFCLNWAYGQCGHLRIDTHGDNTVMQALLHKLGFVRTGIIFVEEDDDPRFAYEKSALTGGTGED